MSSDVRLAGDDVLRRLWRVPEIRSRLARLAVALLLVRLLTHVPLPNRPSNLATVFHDDAFLVLFDVFTGGAAARFSVVALGLFPYLAARLLSSVILREQIEDDPHGSREQVTRLSYLLAAVGGVAMAGAYLFVLVRSGLTLEIDLLAGAALLVTLSAGSVLLAWLTHIVSSVSVGSRRSGTSVQPGLVLAIGALATLPGYLLGTRESALDVVFRVGLFLLILSVYAVLSAGERRVAYQRARVPMPGEKRPSKTASSLPLPFISPQLTPIFYLLVFLGIMHVGASFLRQSDTAWIQALARREHILTDIARWNFWFIFIGFGVLLTITFDFALFNQANWGRNLQIAGTFIPGVSPGRRTEAYLRRISLRLAVPGALIVVGLLATPGLLAYLLGDARPWPLLVVPAVYVVRPIKDLWRSLEAESVLHSYSDHLLVR